MKNIIEILFMIYDGIWAGLLSGILAFVLTKSSSISSETFIIVAIFHFCVGSYYMFGVEKMKKFKKDLIVAFCFSTIIALLIYFILGLLGCIISFLVSFTIMVLCSYITNGIHSKIFPGDEPL